MATIAASGIPAPATVISDGSFSASVPAKAGDNITLRATDAASRVAGPVPVGTAPFFTIVSDQRGTRDDDPNFYARRIASDGTATTVTNGTRYGAQPSQTSSRVLLFKQPDASTPPAITPFDVGAGPINDEVVRSGYAYVAADRFAIVDSANTTPVRYLADSDPTGREYAVALSGNYAYTSEGNASRNGTIFIYDISSPSAPKLVKTQAISPASGIDYRKLIVSGGYLYAISPDANRDVTIIDITSPTAPVRIAELDVPSFAAFAGVLEGTTLVLAGGDAGVAIVDVSTPSSPRVLSVIDTPGIAFATAITGPNEVAVADGASGLTFLDTSDKQHPIVLGSQPLQGNAIDVRVTAGQIYVATETRFYIVKRP
jgi:hypothetical protein